MPLQLKEITDIKITGQDVSQDPAVCQALTRDKKLCAFCRELLSRLTGTQEGSLRVRITETEVCVLGSDAQWSPVECSAWKCSECVTGVLDAQQQIANLRTAQPTPTLTMQSKDDGTPQKYEDTGHSAITIQPITQQGTEKSSEQPQDYTAQIELQNRWIQTQLGIADQQPVLATAHRFGRQSSVKDDDEKHAALLRCTSLQSQQDATIAYAGRPNTEAKALEQATFMFQTEMAKPAGVRKGIREVDGVWEMDYVVFSALGSAPIGLLTNGHDERGLLNQEEAALKKLPESRTIQIENRSYQVRFKPILLSKQIHYVSGMESFVDPIFSGRDKSQAISNAGVGQLGALFSQDEPAKQAFELYKKARQQRSLLPEEELLYVAHLCDLLHIPLVCHCKSSVDRTGILIALASSLQQWKALGVGAFKDPCELLKYEEFKELFAANLMAEHQITYYTQERTGGGYKFGRGSVQQPIPTRLLPARYLTKVPLAQRSLEVVGCTALAALKLPVVALINLVSLRCLWAPKKSWESLKSAVLAVGKVHEAPLRHKINTKLMKNWHLLHEEEAVGLSMALASELPRTESLSQGGLGRVVDVSRLSQDATSRSSSLLDSRSSSDTLSTSSTSPLPSSRPSSGSSLSQAGGTHDNSMTEGEVWRCYQQRRDSSEYAHDVMPSPTLVDKERQAQRQAQQQAQQQEKQRLVRTNCRDRMRELLKQRALYPPIPSEATQGDSSSDRQEGRRDSVYGFMPALSSQQQQEAWDLLRQEQRRESGGLLPLVPTRNGQGSQKNGSHSPAGDRTGGQTWVRIQRNNMPSTQEANRGQGRFEQGRDQRTITLSSFDQQQRAQCREASRRSSTFTLGMPSPPRGWPVCSRVRENSTQASPPNGGGYSRIPGGRVSDNDGELGSASIFSPETTPTVTPYGAVPPMGVQETEEMLQLRGVIQVGSLPSDSNQGGNAGVESISSGPSLTTETDPILEGVLQGNSAPGKSSGTDPATSPANGTLVVRTHQVLDQLLRQGQGIVAQDGTSPIRKDDVGCRVLALRLIMDEMLQLGGRWSHLDNTLVKQAVQTLQGRKHGDIAKVQQWVQRLCENVPGVVERSTLQELLDPKWLNNEEQLLRWGGSILEAYYTLLGKRFTQNDILTYALDRLEEAVNAAGESIMLTQELGSG